MGLEPGRKEDDDGDADVPSGLKGFFGGTWKQTARYYEAAWGLIGGLFGMAFLGWTLDKLLGTGPKLMLVGLLIGGVFGFYWLGRVMFTRT